MDLEESKNKTLEVLKRIFINQHLAYLFFRLMIFILFANSIASLIGDPSNGYWCGAFASLFLLYFLIDVLVIVYVSSVIGKLKSLLFPLFFAILFMFTPISYYALIIAMIGPSYFHPFLSIGHFFVRVYSCEFLW